MTRPPYLANTFDSSCSTQMAAIHTTSWHVDPTLQSAASYGGIYIYHCCADVSICFCIPKQPISSMFRVVWGLFLDLSSRCHVPGGGAIAVSSIPSSSGFCTTSSITVIRGQKKKLVKLTNHIKTTQSVGWTSALCQTVNARCNSCNVVEHG